MKNRTLTKEEFEKTFKGETKKSEDTPQELQQKAIEPYINDMNKKSQKIINSYFKNFIGEKFGGSRIKEIIIVLTQNETPFYTINTDVDGVNIRYLYHIDSDKLFGEFNGRGHVSISDDKGRVIVLNNGAANLLNNFIVGLSPNTKYIKNSNYFILVGDSTIGNDIWEKGINAV